jgi:hypothetical protein
MSKENTFIKDSTNDWGWDFVPSKQDGKACHELLLMADHNCPFHGICPVCGSDNGDDCSGDNL